VKIAYSYNVVEEIANYYHNLLVDLTNNYLKIIKSLDLEFGN
jgi:hypothetical protein